MNTFNGRESMTNAKKVWSQPEIKAISLRSAQGNPGTVTNDGMPAKS